MAGSKYVCKPKDKIDTIDLEIIRCLSRDCRASYREISSIVGITIWVIFSLFVIVALALDLGLLN